MAKNLKNGKATIWNDNIRLNGTNYEDKYTKAYNQAKLMIKD